MIRLLTLSFATVLSISTVAVATPHERRARHHSASSKETALNKAPSASITIDSINSASLSNRGAQDTSLIFKAEVLLDRDHFSPGQIDGEDGDNFKNALAAFDQANGISPTGQMDADTWKRLTSDVTDNVLQKYKISNEDVTGPFVKTIPSSLVQMAKLPGLSYATPREQLAEKFHMSEALLATLNPGVRFDRAGTEIVVADVIPLELHGGQHSVEIAKPTDKGQDVGKARTIVVDKPAHNVRAYDKDGKLVGFYPATIGSQEKPAPTGTFSIRRVAWNPDYHYDPKFAWKGVKTDRRLTVGAGPNNPVGLVWIDLSAPSYGVHGTPNPEKIGKTASHGCIRLTNWDAVDLARMVRRGTVVKFEDQDSPVVPASDEQSQDNTAQSPARSDEQPSKDR